MFLTKKVARSLDLRSMTVRTVRCEGLNYSRALAYDFNAAERSKEKMPWKLRLLNCCSSRSMVVPSYHHEATISLKKLLTAGTMSVDGIGTIRHNIDHWLCTQLEDFEDDASTCARFHAHNHFTIPNYWRRTGQNKRTFAGMLGRTNPTSNYLQFSHSSSRGKDVRTFLFFPLMNSDQTNHMEVSILAIDRLESSLKWIVHACWSRPLSIFTNDSE